MRSIQLILFVFHGLVHLIGFSKAFALAAKSQLSQSITKTNGVLWFATTVLFIATAVIFFLNMDWWWMLALVAILVSQYLIFTSWQDAKPGTIINGVILFAIIIGFATWNYSRQYKNEVNESLRQSTDVSTGILSHADIQHLPNPVKKYLYYTGAVGMPKVKNFKLEFSGQIRQSEQAGWMPFISQQYNFLPTGTRLFFMKATMKHLPVAGFHCFKEGNASMDIRLLSLFNVQYQSGKEMNIAETVTFFNDMCVMAPSTLIDNRIKWITEEGNSVKAEFTNAGITICAWLHFNEKGELINFISDDRYALTENNTMEKTRWSTPLRDYQEMNGYKLATYGEAIYRFPKGEFCYGKFRLTRIDYNVTHTQ